MQVASLDRFAVGLADPQEREPELVCKCSCGCGEDILVGYEYIEVEGDWFADITCFLKHHGAEWRFAEVMTNGNGSSGLYA